jgi:glycosyltransferase involved in cell wall biosynthesis/GT2 family glycosyltransferase
MNRRPYATVIVPTYNQDGFLSQALDSLLAQTDADWEAIVVNDGSTDRTAEIAEDFARRDSRIRCIHKTNGGVASALNAGLEAARGQWVHWLSSDDLFEPNKLAINRRWIELHPDSNFFFSYFTLLRDVNGVKERRELWGPLPDPEHQILTLFFRNYVSGIAICVRREAWVAVGFFDESLYYAQDYDQWLRLLQKNQGVFIPEWTVISRNHAEQGSETFADACYFDTAKAAIRFLNKHSFADLVPWVDLTDKEAATKAVVHALDVACDRTAFIYCLGPHPALVLRLLEWIFSGNNRHPEIINLIRSRIAEMSLNDGDDNWAWTWRQLAVAIQGPGRVFSYSPIDPKQLALMEYRSRRTRGESSQKPLRDYLIRFEDVDADAESSIRQDSGSARIVFLIDRPAENLNLFGATDQLVRRGYRPIVLIADRTNSAATWQWHGCVPIIRIAAFDRDTLPWLGDVELSVTTSGSAASIWLGSLQQLVLADGLSASDIAQSVIAALAPGDQQAIRPVVFLERVLWGGGAERVVFDIVRHLDRRRYRPAILTMCEEHTCAPKLPPHVEVVNVREKLYCCSITTEEFPARACTDVQPPAASSRWETRLRRIYHRILTPDIRERLRLGQRLSALRQAPISVATRMEMSATSSGQVISHNAVAAPILDFDYIHSMAHHNPAAVGLARAMENFGDHAALITVMEEAAVTAWLAQAVRRAPYVVSLHTFESACLRDIYSIPSRFVAEWRLLSAACNDAHAVTFPSLGCCRDLEDHFMVPRAVIHKIWNPVDCARVRRLSMQRIDAIEQWQSSANCFRMVHVGRLDPQKNHELALAVCVELCKRQRKFSLSIVGGGQGRKAIEQRVEALGLTGFVLLVGEQENPFAWMAAADALLLTSRFEAFALVLVEAMACGTPVISVDCPTGPAEVLGNGEFGLLAPNDDPVALANAVERLMDDSSLAQRLSESGYERAQEFDVKKIVPQWEALVDALPHGQG